MNKQDNDERSWLDDEWAQEHEEWLKKFKKVMKHVGIGVAILAAVVALGFAIYVLWLAFNDASIQGRDGRSTTEYAAGASADDEMRESGLRLVKSTEIAAEYENQGVVDVAGKTGGGESSYTDGTVTVTLYDDGVLKFTGDDATIDGHFVWARFDSREKKSVRTIVIGEGIVCIDSCEFSDKYPNLTEVIFEGHLNAIGYLAFFNNCNLRKVTFVQENACDHIEWGAFEDCYVLEEVVNLPIPNGEPERDVFTNAKFQSPYYPGDSESSWDKYIEAYVLAHYGVDLTEAGVGSETAEG